MRDNLPLVQIKYYDFTLSLCRYGHPTLSIKLDRLDDEFSIESVKKAAKDAQAFQRHLVKD